VSTPVKVGQSGDPACGKPRAGGLLHHGHAILLLLLLNERLVDVGNDTTAGNGGLRSTTRPNKDVGRSRVALQPFINCSCALCSITSHVSTKSIPCCQLVGFPAARSCAVGQQYATRTLMRVSSSSSPRMASCKWRGVIRLTCREAQAGSASAEGVGAAREKPILVCGPP
jgi:hypothetical protein